MRDTSLYYVGGIRWPSVTEVIELAGFVDFGSIPKRTLRDAAIRGNDAHEWIEALDRGILDPDQAPDERIAGYVEGWRRFRSDHDLETHSVEHVVRHPEHRYCGTLDWRGKVNGRLAIVDYKTALSIEPWVGLQLAAYALCLPEPHQRLALQLSREGTYKLHPFESRHDAHDFLAANRAAHYRLRHGLAALED